MTYPHLHPILAAILLTAACDAPSQLDLPDPSTTVPHWAADAVFYQIFPERFANGDVSNDPTRESLERPHLAPDTWRITPWTADWYERTEWEKAMGDDFYDSVFHRRYGGDLQGVIDRLDYLADLGINAIYFNPIFWARSLHKYDGNTYHHIDPFFGPDPEGDLALIAAEDPLDVDSWAWTTADRLFLTLLEEAHTRNIRVVIDGVWNHTGRDFFAFADIRERQDASRFKDWYIVKSFDDPSTPENEFDYQGWWGTPMLPEFADTEDGKDLHPGPKAYVYSVASRWMDPNGDGDPSDGIDGWRLDVTPDMPADFWRDWNAHVRTINPDTYTVSEIWQDASRFIKQTGFSATMNYHAFALPVKAFLIDGALGAGAFAKMLDDRRSRYDKSSQFALQNLTDSHDTDRLASMIVNRDDDYTDPDVFDFDRNVTPRSGIGYDVRMPNEHERRVQHLVALFQMTYVGAPMIYYGTEAGMWGADDPDDRMPMVWPELEYAPQVYDAAGRATRRDTVAFDDDLHAYYKQLIGVRRDLIALRRGTFRLLDSNDESQTIAYLREHPGATALVVLNRSDGPTTVTVSRTVLPKETLPYEVAVATDSSFGHAEVDGYLRLSLPPVSGAVLVPTRSK